MANPMLTNIAIPIVALPALGAGGYGAYEVYDDLATKSFVIEYVADTQEPIRSDLNQIIGAQIALQLAELYKARCNGYSNRNTELMIEGLESVYRSRMGHAYRPPSCEFLRAQT